MVTFKPGIDPRVRTEEHRTIRRQLWQDGQLANNASDIDALDDATSQLWEDFMREFAQAGDINLWMNTRKAMTITQVYSRRYILGGGAGSIDFMISHHPTFRFAFPNNVFTVAQTANAATQVSHNPDNIAAVPAGSAIWVTFSNRVGNIEDLCLTLQWEWS